MCAILVDNVSNQLYFSGVAQNYFSKRKPHPKVNAVFLCLSYGGSATNKIPERGIRSHIFECVLSSRHQVGLKSLFVGVCKTFKEALKMAYQLSECAELKIRQIAAAFDNLSNLLTATETTTNTEILSYQVAPIVQTLADALNDAISNLPFKIEAEK